MSIETVGRGGGLLAVLLSVAMPEMAMAASERLRLEGDYIQGGLLVGRTEPGTRVESGGRELRVAGDGSFLIGFHRDDGPESKLALTYLDGTTERHSLRIETREYAIQRIDGLSRRKVEPNADDMRRIRAEQKLINRARRTDDPRTDFLDGFIWPVAGPISGVYGSQRILNGQPRQPHYGVDIAMPAGTAVRAPAAGVVTLAEPDLFFTGGTLALDHGHGLSSWFLHLSRLLVAEGERVQQGEVIAEIGATGRVTGAHLDWRMNLFEKRIDPQLLVPPMEEVLAAQPGGDHADAGSATEAPGKTPN